MLHWGMGRVEALAVKNEILEMLDRGYPVSTIYRLMHDTGRVTMGRAAFYKNVAAIKKDRQRDEVGLTDAVTSERQGNQAVAEMVADPLLAKKNPAGSAPKKTGSRSTASYGDKDRIAGKLAPEDDDADDLM